LEPGTSFPYPKPIERMAGRVPKLNGGESYRSKVTFRGLISGEEVQRAEASIRKLQKAAPEVQTTPLHA
jgi:hypothetical protein